ncbi:hypothetical protein [Acinetobacter sp. Ver3]|uniref:hypothetical protein n=1 Tax=Acinetobacter sp. Ver3 TaxID=466088 RepID=UPI000445C86D|nr:hypothetical protein [Acinetobacter sp. Ver3]EZQ10788.1 hypothetical protein CL42_06505 [Acinetobacter sp. Ver3]
MTEIQRTNIDFAKNFLELIGPRVGNGTGIQGTLTDGELGALYHIVQEWLIEHDLPESVVESLGEVS